MNLKYHKRIGVYSSSEYLFDRALERECIEQKDKGSKKKKGGEKFKERGSNKFKADSAGIGSNKTVEERKNE